MSTRHIENEPQPHDHSEDGALSVHHLRTPKKAVGYSKEGKFVAPKAKKLSKVKISGELAKKLINETDPQKKARLLTDLQIDLVDNYKVDAPPLRAFVRNKWTRRAALVGVTALATPSVLSAAEKLGVQNIASNSTVSKLTSFVTNKAQTMGETVAQASKTLWNESPVLAGSLGIAGAAASLAALGMLGRRLVKGTLDARKKRDQDLKNLRVRQEELRTRQLQVEERRRGEQER